MDYNRLQRVIKNPGMISSYLAQSVVGDIITKINSNFILPASIYAHSKFEIGDHVFDEDWDMLVVLDTCRPDALRMVADEYDFITDVETRWSVGADSWEWFANTFDRQYADIIENSAYITSNASSKMVLQHQFDKNQDDQEIRKPKLKRMKKFGYYNIVGVSEFGEYVPLYDYGLGGHFGISGGLYPSPRNVTDHGILSDRNNDFDRIILHYMPPHAPYLARSVSADTDTMYDRIELADEGRPRSFEAYLDNLRWGLEEVSLLLENVDRDKVVITADHGESFSDYGRPHISGSIKPTVRKVPWVVTTATDSGTYQPEIDEKQETHDRDDVLEALGYKA